MNKDIKWALVIVTSFWNASITIFWGFVALLFLTAYKMELLEMSKLLFEVRLFLINYWQLFWIGFFGLDILKQIKENKDD